MGSVESVQCQIFPCSSCSCSQHVQLPLKCTVSVWQRGFNLASATSGAVPPAFLCLGWPPLFASFSSVSDLHPDMKGWNWPLIQAHLELWRRKVKVSVTKLRPTLCDPMDCTSGSAVHGILQARILKWVAIPFSRGYFHPTQGLNRGLLHCRQLLYWLSHEGRCGKAETLRTSAVACVGSPWNGWISQGLPQLKAVCACQVQVLGLLSARCTVRAPSQMGHASPQGSWSQAVIPSIALWCPGSWEHVGNDWWLAHSLGEMRRLGLRLQQLLAFCLWLLLTCLSVSEESLHLLCCSSLSISSLIL